MLNENLINNEQFMFELSNWIEIHNTKFFNTIFDGYCEEEFDDLLRYLTYLSKDRETKQTYPKTIYYIKEIIQSIEKVKNNVLIINNTLKDL
jgi:hypothetical protein